MSGHIEDHCSPPKVVRRLRTRGLVWACDCGTLFRVNYRVHLTPVGGDTIWFWERVTDAEAEADRALTARLAATPPGEHDPTGGDGYRRGPRDTLEQTLGSHVQTELGCSCGWKMFEMCIALGVSPRIAHRGHLAAELDKLIADPRWYTLGDAPNGAGSDE